MPTDIKNCYRPDLSWVTFFHIAVCTQSQTKIYFVKEFNTNLLVRSYGYFSFCFVYSLVTLTNKPRPPNCRLTAMSIRVPTLLP